MGNREPFSDDEWYHCYARGVEKRKTFLAREDYLRFVQTLYVANSDTSIHRSDLWYLSHADFFSQERGNPLVAIGAYCLMPNHFHILLQQKVEGGLAKFMQKVGTSYAMYFNIKNERQGNLFVRPFRSKHISTDEYFQHAVEYIHLNPADLYAQEWKKGIVKNVRQLEKLLQEYEYSSLPDFLGLQRSQTVLIDHNAKEVIEFRPLKVTISDAIDYHREIH